MAHICYWENEAGQAPHTEIRTISTHLQVQAIVESEAPNSIKISMHDLGVAIQLGGGAKESAIKLLLHNKHPIFT